MIHLLIPEFSLPVLLTSSNECQVKEMLQYLPSDTLIRIQETGDIERLDTIFYYDFNHVKA
jgi:hypothetical protein